MNTSPYLLLILLFLFSCDPQPVLHPEEEKLLGVWHEIADKILHLDSTGAVLDSISISAIYEFNNDYSYTSQNEFWTEATHGTWEFDSSYTILYIYPLDGSIINIPRKDRWDIVHIPPIMEVGHTFDHVFPDSSIGAIHYNRKFEKIQ